MSIRAIVVDNSEELLEKITRILREMEDVELCGSFGEAIAAIQYVKENPVDIVFSDVVMPDISGITLASKIYQLPAKSGMKSPFGGLPFFCKHLDTAQLPQTICRSKGLGNHSCKRCTFYAPAKLQNKI